MWLKNFRLVISAELASIRPFCRILVEFVIIILIIEKRVYSAKKHVSLGGSKSDNFAEENHHILP